MLHFSLLALLCCIMCITVATCLVFALSSVQTWQCHPAVVGDTLQFLAVVDRACSRFLSNKYFIFLYP